jgi:O-antigen ligase
MNVLFRLNDSLANKISYYHLVALMVSLPFDMFYSHLILISLTIIHFKKHDVKPVFRLRTLALQSVFFVSVLGTIYTINRHEAFNEWGKQITILVFPLLFCFNPIDLKKYRPQLLMWFAVVCAVTTVYLYANAFVVIAHYNLPVLTIFSNYFTNHNFSDPIGMHATFFSMQVLLSLVFVLSALIKEQKFYIKLFCLLCSLVLILGLIQLCSKSIFVVLIIALNLVLPWFLLQGSKRRKFILISLPLSVLLMVGISASDAFRDRYIDELKNDLSKSPFEATKDTRMERWDVSLELIKKSPVIGYGSGSEIGLLQDGFFQKKLFDSYLKNLNTHSQYLSFLLKSGIIGLLIYLLTLAFGFTLSLRQNDFIFFTFMMLIAIVSVSENLLDVDKGIFFYAFFFSFFIFSPAVPEYGFKPLIQHNYLESVATKNDVVTS